MNIIDELKQNLYGGDQLKQGASNVKMDISAILN